MIYREIDLREDGSSVLKVYAADPLVSTSRQLRKRRPTLVVCPGGGYLITAVAEAEISALRFLGQGFQVFVLDYLTYFRRHPALTAGAPEVNPASRPPEQLRDLMRTMAYVHDHADELEVDTDHVYCLGFSAGANLVGTLAERWDEPGLLEGADAAHLKPRGILLGYPMIDATESVVPSSFENAAMAGSFHRALTGTDDPTPEQLGWFDLVRHARPDMPPAFVFHSADDPVARPARTLAFASRLAELGVPCELHLFQTGGHGKALADVTVAADEGGIDERFSSWADLALSWMRADGAGAELSHA